MNLKFYSKLANELCFNAAGAQTSQQGPQWRICSSNHGNVSGSHLPQSVISSVASHHNGSTSGSCGTATEDAEPLDIWAVIKPGHVREKIAMFGSDGRRSSGNRALSPGVRKSKGNWEEKGRAKRQRHLGNQNVPWDTTFWRHLDWSPRSADGGRTETVGEGEELKVSVVEMVACLEKRFCQQQQQRRRCGTKPVLPLQKSSPTPTMLSSLPPPPPASLMATPPSPNADTPPTASSGEASASLKTPDPPFPSEETEPLPGLLFRSPPPPETSTGTDSARPPVPEGGASQQASGAETCAFLEVRQRLQQLLEPQPFLTLLPHHLLVQIFALLPTRSLAALKCACRYFRFIINTYGVRPADSLWVSDPCYSDDPCKQCKRRYGRGDVSLCRWHHKPFCQALPYGPGYWMCCRSVHKDTPGCNVGLHDNRWVPAFHSMNVPICRWSKQEE
uniref:F-box protein 34 n=1 Tax=Takifugu rubripes TaxID=31033 RepID=A0A3B5KFN5_TAKRU